MYFGVLAIFTNGSIGGEVYKDLDYHLVRCALGSSTFDWCAPFYSQCSPFHSHCCSAGPVITVGVALGLRVVATTGGMHLEDNHMVSFSEYISLVCDDRVSLEMGSGNLCIVFCTSRIWRCHSLV